MLPENLKRLQNYKRLIKEAKNRVRFDALDALLVKAYENKIIELEREDKN
jgi:hypothetical protein